MNIPPFLLHVFAVVQLNTCTYCFIQMMYCFCNYVHILLSMPWRMLSRCVMFAEIKHLSIIIVYIYCNCAAVWTLDTAESFWCVSLTSCDSWDLKTCTLITLRNHSAADFLIGLDFVKCLQAVGQINQTEMKTLNLRWLLR